jgi:hypothetical protein
MGSSPKIEELIWTLDADWVGEGRNGGCDAVYILGGAHVHTIGECRSNAIPGQHSIHVTISEIDSYAEFTGRHC